MTAYKTPKQKPSAFCKGCWIYEKRNAYAAITHCVWDYATCYTACLKRNLQPYRPQKQLQQQKST